MSSNDENNIENESIEDKLKRLEKILNDLKLKHEFEEQNETQEKDKRKYEWPDID